MSKFNAAVLILVGAIVGFGLVRAVSLKPPPAKQKIPDPPPPAKPEIPKTPPAQPQKPRRPWRQLVTPAVAGNVWGAWKRTSPKGTELQIDFPVDSQWIRNKGGSDGAGMCVDSSGEMSMRWAGRDDWIGFRDYWAQERGGGWPERVRQQVTDYPGKKNVQPLDWVQYTGSDPAVLEAVLQAGFCPAVTYGTGHMTCCVHFDAAECCIMDNNGDPQSCQYWMSRQAGWRKMAANGSIWLWAALGPGPVMPPCNGSSARTVNARRYSFPSINERVPWVHGMLFDVPRDREQCEINGRSVDKQNLLALLAWYKWRRENALAVTVIGTPQETMEVKNDFQRNADLAAWANQIILRFVPPTHWSVKGTGIVTNGRPVIMLQRGKKELHRQLAYTGPAGVLGALRSADPAYDANKTPDKSQSAGVDPSQWKIEIPLPWEYLAVAAGFILLLLKR